MKWWTNLSRDWQVGVAAIVLIVVGTLGCIGADWWQSQPERPGDPAVYQRIESSTNCALLQAEFDTADRNRKAALSRGNQDQATASLAYMEAAEARRQRLGC